jgi:hypothetical protein
MIILKTTKGGFPMIEKTKIINKYVMIESRKQRFVTCPHCWTDQRTDRNLCYHCGAVFVYLDETAKCKNA